MVELLTLDSSVLVAALREAEEKHQICQVLFQRIVEGEYLAIEPYSVLVEVVAAVKRRTGDLSFAQKVRKDLLQIETITFEELLKFRAEKACKIAEKTGVRGMDALVVQIAKENNCPLITLDRELMEWVKSEVKVKQAEDLI